MAYRDDLLALSARHDALASEVAQKARELEESRQWLDQARARARLPVLDHLRVASPCTADWNQMTGDDRARHCRECRQNVYNLSGMTRDQAEALLLAHHGDLCVRYYQRSDGTILLADCTVGVERRSHRRRRIAAGAAALLVGGIGASALNGTRTVMGSIDRGAERLQMFEMSEIMEPGEPRSPPPAIDPDRSQVVDGEVPVAPPTMQLPAVDAPNRPAHTSEPKPKMGRLVRVR